MKKTYLAVDELEITRTLGVAISSSVFSSSLVGGVLLQAAVCVHGDEVERTVQATRQVRQIDVKGKLIVRRELEHLIRGIVLHQIGARPNVRRVRSFGDELQLQ